MRPPSATWSGTSAPANSGTSCPVTPANRATTRSAWSSAIAPSATLSVPETASAWACPHSPTGRGPRPVGECGHAHADAVSGTESVALGAIALDHADLVVARFAGVTGQLVPEFAGALVPDNVAFGGLIARHQATLRVAVQERVVLGTQRRHDHRRRVDDLVHVEQVERHAGPIVAAAGDVVARRWFVPLVEHVPIGAAP